MVPRLGFGNGDPLQIPSLGTIAGVILRYLCAPHPPVRQPASTTWVASRRLPADDPERSLQFWENSRYTATARVAEANERATARVAAALPDRVHSSMWHHHRSSDGIRTNSPAAGSNPAPEPEPEPETETATPCVPSFAGSAAHPPVFSAEVSQAAAMYRVERKRHALSVPQVRLSNGQSCEEMVLVTF